VGDGQNTVLNNAYNSIGASKNENGMEATGKVYTGSHDSTYGNTSDTGVYTPKTSAEYVYNINMFG